MLRGYRRYRLVRGRDSAHLHGVLIPWMSAILSAECIPWELGGNGRWKKFDDEQREALRRDAAEHLSMATPPCGSQNSCGIYITETRQQLEGAVYGFGDVEVQMVGWGKVADYERGWRVEHARIEHIWLLANQMHLNEETLDGIVSLLGVRYGCLVTIDGEASPRDLRHGYDLFPAEAAG